MKYDRLLLTANAFFFFYKIVLAHFLNDLLAYYDLSTPDVDYVVVVVVALSKKNRSTIKSKCAEEYYKVGSYQKFPIYCIISSVYNSIN